MEIDLDQIRELMRAVKEHDISELEIEQEGSRIFLRRGAEPVVLSAVPSMAAPAPAFAPGAAASGAPAVVVEEGEYVTSPFVGTFYRASSPDAAPFVSVGDRVTPGTVLCIIEAMKLMNEIESEISGELLEVLVTNGKSVEYGERLFRIRKG